ncbi:uncharacterized protein LY79DRAFT_279289 [Colletotrichum navitas]|uniref:Uncharacterized protein n=1 Tax=Colletotrichum navitas TaxID=681940 RepID=A0AAD8V2L9_9PEZI|nr:uncharacterized protein LY79DRAFT_279289 [Colletotrichum navitas]KAK1584903.1 hypothetical protein LY79DRAFT_279289 [Colletotrichum navitas]
MLRTSMFTDPAVRTLVSAVEIHAWRCVIFILIRPLPVRTNDSKASSFTFLIMETPRALQVGKLKWRANRSFMSLIVSRSYNVSVSRSPGDSTSNPVHFGTESLKNRPTQYRNDASQTIIDLAEPRQRQQSYDRPFMKQMEDSGTRERSHEKYDNV